MDKGGVTVAEYEAGLVRLAAAVRMRPCGLDFYAWSLVLKRAAKLIEEQDEKQEQDAVMEMNLSEVNRAIEDWIGDAAERTGEVHQLRVRRESRYSWHAGIYVTPRNNEAGVPADLRSREGKFLVLAYASGRNYETAVQTLATLLYGDLGQWKDGIVNPPGHP